ncbi:hypothetical protein RUND412_006724 [Rhizina undulata]
METENLPSADWDVLISGTGVEQSLLAVALGRAGKKVLQIDKNPYYGSSEAAFSLDEVDEWVKQINSLTHNSAFSDAVVTRYGPEDALKRSRAYTISLSPHFMYWNSSILELLRDADMTGSFSWQAMGSWWVFLTDEDVSIPASAGGGIGEAVMEAGVKVAKAAAKKKAWNKGRAKEAPTPTTTDSTFGPSEECKSLPELNKKEGSTSTLRKIGGTIREVPCTFEDVAWSEDLTDKDRGYLGAFLRFVMRNQDDERHKRIFEGNKSVPLPTLLSTIYKLPPSIVSSIHSLTLLPHAPSKSSVETSVTRLATHAKSLGKIPEIRSSAALILGYGGSAELCQVFSRGAAVAGGLNVLERGVKTITLAPKTNANATKKMEQKVQEGEIPEEDNKNRNLEVKLSNDEVIHVDWIVGSDEDLPSSEIASETKEVVSKGIFIVQSTLDKILEKKYADDKIAPSAAVVTFPAGSVKLEEAGAEIRNEAPVYIIVHSASTEECPRDQSVLYTSTLVSTAGDVARRLSQAAVENFLSNFTSSELSSTTPEILYSLQYIQSSFAPLQVDTQNSEHIIRLKPMRLDLVFDDQAVSEALEVYEKVLGTKIGFMDLPEELRKIKEEMEEEGF